MERHFEQELERIKTTMLRMGGLVEEMVGNAVKALSERDDELAQRIIGTDRQVDLMEMEADDLCHEVLARHQPTAGDLRFLVAVMKILSDLERIGDSAVNIAQSVVLLNQEAPLEPAVFEIPPMANTTRQMVRDALDAFTKKSSDLALQVCGRDDLVDAAYRNLFRHLHGTMLENPNKVNRALHLLLVSRNLERIADHATNIAEDVIYYVEGRDIRHSGNPAEPAGSN
jgi:phosphate transport system protein